MFSKKNSDAKPIIRNISSSTNITYLAEDCDVKGSMVSNGNLRIDGRIEGTLTVAGDLIIGQTAVLKANIEAQTVTLAGEVHGNINVGNLLELSSTAHLYGDIVTKQLKIDQGAVFIGSSTFSKVDNEDTPIITP